MSDPYAVFSRRRFMLEAGSGLLAVGLTDQTLAGVPGAEMKSSGKPEIAVQLWSVRREFESDLAATLDRLARIGFAGVETAFLPEGISPAQAGRLIRSAGLKVVSSHCELPVSRDPRPMLELAEAYDCRKMVWHGWPEDPRYRTAEGVRELAGIYNDAAALAASNGLEFGVHNHWWEFQKQEDGRYPLDILLTLLDERIFVEVDTYWAKVAGADPAAVISRLGGRARLLHLKDGPGTRDDPMVALGKGVQDMSAILNAAKGSAEVLIVEFDEFDGDIFVALEESCRFLSGRG